MPGSHSRVVSFFSAFKITLSSSNTRSPWVIVVFTTGWMNKATDIVKRFISRTQRTSLPSLAVYIYMGWKLSFGRFANFTCCELLDLDIEKMKESVQGVSEEKVKSLLKSSRWHRDPHIHLVVWVDCRFGRKLNAKCSWLSPVESDCCLCPVCSEGLCLCEFCSMPFSLKFWDHTENVRYKVYFKSGETC